MSTPNDLITIALRKLGVTAAGEVPSADEGQDALNQLNLMMFGFNMNGIDFVHQTLGLASPMNCPPEQEEAVMYMLLERLAGEYGVTLSPVDESRAMESKALMQAWYSVVPTVAMDAGVRFMPSLRWGYGSFWS